LGRGGADNSNLSDQANSSFGTDEKLLEVVASVVLAQSRERVNDSPVRQDCLKTQNRSMKRAIAQQSQTTGISRHVSSNMARSLSTQVQREQVVALCEVLVGDLKNHTGIGNQYTGSLVE
jgi:hypothetical protein